MQLTGKAKAFIKRKNAPDEVIMIVLDTENEESVTSYQLFTVGGDEAEYLGRVLFDDQGYWIYDGDVMEIAEKEQIAKFIINYVEML